MRVTVTIDDDVLAVARALAERREISLGSALSELVRRGIRDTSKAVNAGSGTVVPVAPGGEQITSEDVYASLRDWP